MQQVAVPVEENIRRGGGGRGEDTGLPSLLQTIKMIVKFTKFHA
jgi:hypothetical protein